MSVAGFLYVGKEYNLKDSDQNMNHPQPEQRLHCQSQALLGHGLAINLLKGASLGLHAKLLIQDVVTIILHKVIPQIKLLEANHLKFCWFCQLSFLCV